MLTRSTAVCTARRAVCLCEYGTNIGVVPRPNVNWHYRSDSLPAVATVCIDITLLYEFLVHMAVGHVNIGVVPRPNVNRGFRSDSLLAVEWLPFPKVTIQNASGFGYILRYC